MRLREICIVAATLIVVGSGPSRAIDENFANRRALIANTCPYVELSDFSFQNRFDGRSSTRFEQNLSWKNIGAQPIIAFEVVILKYDPFNQRQIGTRWVITGHDSANWAPLGPGDHGSDGTRGLGEEEVLTAIAYVRAARLADGTVWIVDDRHLLDELKKLVPEFKEFGDVKPDPRKKQE
jgi:hypothetical protein